MWLASYNEPTDGSAKIHAAKVEFTVCQPQRQDGLISRANESKTNANNTSNTHKQNLYVECPRLNYFIARDVTNSFGALTLITHNDVTASLQRTLTQYTLAAYRAR